MRSVGSRRRRLLSLRGFLLVGAICTGFSVLMLTLRPVEPPGRIELPDLTSFEEPFKLGELQNLNESFPRDLTTKNMENKSSRTDSCATVEEMGKVFADDVGERSLRVRRIIQSHFALHGASRVRGLPPEQFCRQGFVLGKASEAGFGNEMYKILTAAGLSIMLKRSLIIGQTRHIGVDFHLENTLCIPIIHLL